MFIVDDVVYYGNDLNNGTVVSPPTHDRSIHINHIDINALLTQHWQLFDERNNLPQTNNETTATAIDEAQRVKVNAIVSLQYRCCLCPFR